jgi:hypothetical protein
MFYDQSAKSKPRIFIMKRICISSVLTLIVLCFVLTGQSFAAISMYLVDDPHEPGVGTMTIDATLIDGNAADEITAELQYSLDGVTYNSLNLHPTEPTGHPFQTQYQHTFDIVGSQIIHFQLALSDIGGTDGDGDVIWLGEPGQEDPPYYGAFIDWGNFTLEVLTSSSGDDFAPISVNLPSALILLSSGLAGLVACRGQKLTK